MKHYYQAEKDAVASNLAKFPLLFTFIEERWRSMEHKLFIIKIAYMKLENPH